MQKDKFKAAVERLNAGAEIPTVAASLIECYWKAISQHAKQQGTNVAICVSPLVTADSAEMPQNPELQFALMLRCGLLDALVERGTLDDYMADESKRKRVFAAAATLPCNGNDLSDALAQRILRNSPVETAEKADEEFKKAGYDLDRPKVGEAFKQWIRDHC